jgi:phosphoribosylformimino-5-aminoimidazole carboxamide ribotide isomerase
MQKTEIIPAIDLIEGKCVRLSQGDYKKKIVYDDDPLKIAKMFEEAGIQRLHLVDLDGAKARHIVNHKILEQIALGTDLIIDFGGGIKSDKDIETAFSSGAAMVTGGSIAVRDPEVFIRWLNKYGSEKIILGADAREGMIAVNGWQEVTELPVVDFISRFHRKGVSRVISTDIGRDGMLSGPSFDLYREIMEKLPGLEIIASGGIASMDDIIKLAEMSVGGVITGKAIYEGRISMDEIKHYNLS